MAHNAPLPLRCWTLALMVWVLADAEPALAVSSGEAAPLFPVLLIVLLLPPGILTPERAR
jgi:hypothetical protein